MRRVCVFCGSRTGLATEYCDAATELGRQIGELGIGLVYGGGSVGLMGVVADAVLDAGGEVIGVLPEKLATKELIHPRVANMQIVDTMHTRKARMAELSDAFVALPGGFGTLEELFEVITWAQLGIHCKPIGLLNTAGYYDALVRFIDHMIDAGFVKEKNRRLFCVEERPDVLLDRLARHAMPTQDQWLSLEET